MKRLIVVYNPRSTHYKRVESEVLLKARELSGWQVGKYEVKATDVDKNAAALAKILVDGDLVVAAGGDATATIAMNACIISGKSVSYAALPYGNFCDAARVCGFKDLREIAEAHTYKRRGAAVEMWPLEILVDGQHWRYSLEYVTIGLFAEATVIFDEKKIREGLRKKRRTKIFSWLKLAEWYMKNRKQREFLPRIKFKNRIVNFDATDYVAMNTTQMAGVMKGIDNSRSKKEFSSAVLGLRKFRKLFTLMARSILYRVPLNKSNGDVLKFEQPGKVMIQAVGEYVWVDVKTQIEIRKSKKSILVMKKAK